MPAPRELQPQMSAAVNQAIMRGMAVEARFRPANVEEWLSLLPNPQLTEVNGTPLASFTHTGTTAPINPQQLAQLKKKSLSSPNFPLFKRFGARGIAIGGVAAIATGLVAVGAVRHQSQPKPTTVTPSPTATVEPFASPLVAPSTDTKNEETSTSNDQTPQKSTPSESPVQSQSSVKRRRSSSSASSSEEPVRRTYPRKSYRQKSDKQDDSQSAPTPSSSSRSRRYRTRVETPSQPASKASSPVSKPTPVSAPKEPQPQVQKPSGQTQAPAPEAPLPPPESISQPKPVEKSVPLPPPEAVQPKKSAPDNASGDSQSRSGEEASGG